MNRPDDEFDDFLSRRKHIFRGIEDPLEPPDELDRLVLHQAREAVEGARPQRMYKGPRFVAPIAIAATLVLAVTVILNVGMPAKQAPVPEVTVQTVAQRIDSPAAAAAPVPAPNKAERAEVAQPAEPASIAADNTSSSIVVNLDTDSPRTAAPGGFVSETEAGRYARTPPAAPPAGVVVVDPVTGSQAVITDVSPPPTEAEQALARARQKNPSFRGESRTWLAEIERLRAEGKGVQADAEFAEYKRQHRALAVSPDR